MNANKQALNRTGQVGLVLLVASMAVVVALEGLLGFAMLLMGVAGFYLLTHQELSLKKIPPSRGPEV